MRRVWLVVQTLVVAGVGGCASAHLDPRTLFLTSWQPPPGQRCSVRKKRVPGVDSVFDTAALARLVGPFGSGRVVATLVFWPGDTAWHEEYGPRPDSLVLVETTFPDSLRAPLRTAVLAAVRRRRSERLLIRLDLGDHPRVRVAPALECPPVVRSQTDLRRYAAALQAYHAPPGRALMQFLVRPDGSLAAFHLRIPSGDRDLDQAALRSVPTLRFIPGLINRAPFPVLVRFPVVVRPSRRGAPPPPTAADCPRGRVVEVVNPLSAAIDFYAFGPQGAQLLGTAGAASKVRLVVPPESSGYGFVEWADASGRGHRERDLDQVRWTVACGLP
jgi:TonB family protein